MTTKQDTPSIAEMLQEKRDGRPKAAIYRALGVSAGTYDMWEGGVYTPDDKYAEVLADHLEVKLTDVVWILYKDRLRPDFVAPLMAPLGRRTVDYGTTRPWYDRPIDDLPDLPRLAA